MNDKARTRDLRPLSPRGERRTQAILKAATEVFLRCGYANATVDDIVKRAGGSKATVYKHFKNKRELFDAVIDSVVVRRSKEGIDTAEPDPEVALKAFGMRRFKVVFSSEHVELMRLIIAEGAQFPDTARNYYEHGPAHSHDVLVSYFDLQNRRGTLKIPDPDAAAFQFMAMLMHRWYLLRLNVNAKPPSQTDADEAVNSAVDAFMRLYRA